VLAEIAATTARDDPEYTAQFARFRSPVRWTNRVLTRLLASMFMLTGGTTVVFLSMARHLAVAGAGLAPVGAGIALAVTSIPPPSRPRHVTRTRGSGRGYVLPGAIGASRRRPRSSDS
jgi:hypothetical protein